jgi:hypothetical protein
MMLKTLLSALIVATTTNNGVVHAGMVNIIRQFYYDDTNCSSSTYHMDKVGERETCSGFVHEKGGKGWSIKYNCAEDTFTKHSGLTCNSTLVEYTKPIRCDVWNYTDKPAVSVKKRCIQVDEANLLVRHEFGKECSEIPTRSYYWILNECMPYGKGYSLKIAKNVSDPDELIFSKYLASNCSVEPAFSWPYKMKVCIPSTQSESGHVERVLTYKEAIVEESIALGLTTTSEASWIQGGVMVGGLLVAMNVLFM